MRALHKRTIGTAAAALLALMLIFSSASAAGAATLTSPADSSGIQSWESRQGGPWAVKAGGRTLAYVRTRAEGENVSTGLRLYYYHNVQMQQEADIHPWISVERVQADTLLPGTKLMTTEEAVQAIAAQNESGDPVVRVTYSDTLQEKKAIHPHRKIIKTASLAKGEQKVKQQGRSGNREVESEITQVNSDVTSRVVMTDTVVQQPGTEIVYEGTALTSRDKGRAIVAYARKFLGGRYVWAGESLARGVDCSGYTMKLYEHYGITLPHNSDEQASCGREVSRSDMQPGDLLIFSGHVAMYAGNGQIIHASGPRSGIILSDESAYDSRILHIRRLFGTADDHSTDEMFPTVKEINKAYAADRGFGKNDGYSKEYSATHASGPVGPTAHPTAADRAGKTQIPSDQKNWDKGKKSSSRSSTQKKNTGKKQKTTNKDSSKSGGAASDQKKTGDDRSSEQSAQQQSLAAGEAD
ncbi:MAG: C40 family peptidase [Anaerovoracaceae bacterium]